MPRCRRAPRYPIESEATVIEDSKTEGGLILEIGAELAPDHDPLRLFCEGRVSLKENGLANPPEPNHANVAWKLGESAQVACESLELVLAVGQIRRVQTHSWAKRGAFEFGDFLHRFCLFAGHAAWPPGRQLGGRGRESRSDSPPCRTTSCGQRRPRVCRGSDSGPRLISSRRRRSILPRPLLLVGAPTSPVWRCSRRSAGGCADVAAGRGSRHDRHRLPPGARSLRWIRRRQAVRHASPKTCRSSRLRAEGDR